MQRKVFTVLGIIALVVVAAVFAAPASLPLAAGDSEEPSAKQEEAVTMLEWILSHPKGEELLEGLSQEIIDRLAVEPMPSPPEPQPVIYGGADAVKLTDEEAKRVAEGAEPREKPPYLREGYVIRTPEGDIICTGILDLREIDKMDVGAIEDVRNYLSKFDPSADLDGDGYRSKAECIAWVENYFDERGLP
jgi:hypothetical protein